MDSVILLCCHRVMPRDNFQEFLPEEEKVEPIKKGTKANPLFYMMFTTQGGVLRLDPYPLLDEKGALGLSVRLKSLWPCVSGYGVSTEIPLTYLYQEDTGPGPFLEFTRSQIICLAEEVEDKFYPRGRWDPLFTLNAFMLLPPTSFPFAIIDAMERRRPTGRFVVLPVQFFHVDVEKV